MTDMQCVRCEGTLRVRWDEFPAGICECECGAAYMVFRYDKLCNELRRQLISVYRNPTGPSPEKASTET